MKISKNISLKNFNTFGVDVNAECLAEIENENDLTLLHQSSLPKPFYPIGHGSNLLFTRDFKGTIVKFVTNTWKEISKNNDSVIIRADAGCSWDDFVVEMLQNGFFGLENLSLIPGTVGSSPVQNIGAYGAEVSQFVDIVRVYDIDANKFFEISNAECGFGYRESIFKHKQSWIVVSVDYKLNTVENTNISYKALSDYVEKNNLDAKNSFVIRNAVIAIRESKLPDYKQIGNAGSFFRNPVVDEDLFNKLLEKHPNMPFYKEENNRFKIPAAWLIDKSGWKGYRNNNVGVFEKQPLILVNHGGAKGSEIKELSEAIQESIKNNFGILLHPEVIIY